MLVINVLQLLKLLHVCESKTYMYNKNLYKYEINTVSFIAVFILLSLACEPVLGWAAVF